ncbi:hypothetical protein T05_13820 [Trichinella murrelli]|uniref:Uncharacterized protein n=1 Tax=Trichinella murrelli TaxID=144512 RepID=A0A0V0U4J5_9BILA|nr:hypothetical protein T05_13820 [Trichinella murrelli]
MVGVWNRQCNFNIALLFFVHNRLKMSISNEELDLLLNHPKPITNLLKQIQCADGACRCHSGDIIMTAWLCVLCGRIEKERKRKKKFLLHRKRCGRTDGRETLDHSPSTSRINHPTLQPNRVGKQNDVFCMQVISDCTK